MKVIPVLLTLLFIQGDVYSDGDKSFCTEQPDSIRVEKGGSVTIPCNFSYPNNNKPTEVRVYWRHSRGGNCANNQIIYNHTDTWTHGNYRGRISMEGNPEKERTATIRIQRLKETDGPMFCCRISLRYNGDKTEEWQNRHGTYIKFKDQFSVEQPDVVPAVMGEDISVPCAVHNKSPDDIERIIWRVGTSDVCAENPEVERWNKQNIIQRIGRWTAQKSENGFSLPIKNVTNSDSGQYCCEVTTKRGTQKQSAHGTQVVILDPNQNGHEFTVTQSPIISANEGDSVTISCSYTVPPNQNLLRRGVFWRVGSPTGPYAYHPSDLMVGSRYIGRTQLSGQADLQINGVQDTDNNTYYCFVMLKFCTGNNKSNSMLRYGGGTQLNIHENDATPTGFPTHTPKIPMSPGTGSSTVLGLQNLSGILAGVGIVLFLIVLCVILFILKKRGVICKKKESVKPSPSPVDHASSAPSTDDNVRMSNVRDSSTAADSPEVPGGLVYAHLNVEALQKGAGKRNKGDASSSDHQVLYAAVKPATDQAIYSAVR